MKNRTVFLLALLTGCTSSLRDVDNNVDSEVKTLRELVNQDLNKNRFYEVLELPESIIMKDGLILVLPSSSCFNCFEELNEYLKEYFSSRPKKGMLVIRNQKIKEREIRFSIQSILSFDRVEILETDQAPFLTSMNFSQSWDFSEMGKFVVWKYLTKGIGKNSMNIFNS
jgi:hypothetical protein